jgi:integrase
MDVRGGRQRQREAGNQPVTINCAVRVWPAPPRRTEEFVGYLRPIVLVALNKGLRRGEILQLERKDVDLNSKSITVAIPQAWPQFRGPRASSAQVFSGSDSEGRQRVDKVRRSLTEIPSIDLNMVRELLGHAEIKMEKAGEIIGARQSAREGIRSSKGIRRGRGAGL